jgi:toxin YoeB
MDVAFTEEAFETFLEWQKTDKQTFRKIIALITDTCREPFTGLGKPEPLKHDLSGCWSRRITDEHRLVYTVEQDTVKIISCKYHY